ncbi:MAG: competence/damage-inducible protein A [Bdellovibrionota bacterium]
MKAEILSTGDEVLTGALVDTNSAYIADEFERMGLEVSRHNTVGDDLPTLVKIFGEIGERSEICAVTGGLGPTTDDLSAEAAAKALGTDLVLDEEALRFLEAFFKMRGRTMSDSNKKQAYFPRGAERLDNPIGTAPGFAVTIGKCRFFFMPGVPHEMKKMLAEQVIPRIEKMRGTEKEVSRLTTISTFGAPESNIGEKVADLPQLFPGVKLGLRAKFPEIQVKLYARGGDPKAVDALLSRATNEALRRVGELAFSDDGSSMERTLGELLKMEKATLAVAESCTGGLIAHWLTNVSGSSDYFRFSGVTYSNDAKMKVLGVKEETLKRHGAVHEQTAKEMADGARKTAGTTYAIATSGIAGPDGGSPEKPVGTVCIGLATPAGAEGYRYQFASFTREMNKELFAMTALDVLRRRLLGLPPPPRGRVDK